ncbi:MAG: hypothetical protein EOM76_12340 [Sphingobacteriia bacterium]|nr:hypothetical protein [Sphingobacteriia bacterium]
MATTIKNEQRILTLETISGAVKLNSEARLNASGDILNINGQIQAGDTHVGSFNVYESPDAKLSTNINVTDSSNLSGASSAVNLLISDIEAMNAV